MLNYEFYSPTKLVLGKDTHKQIGELLKPYCKKVLIHYGGQRIKNNGIFDDVTKSLKENNIEFVELGGVVPNPRLSLVYKGIELCRQENVDLVLAIGGGSAIDSSKAIAMGYYYDGDVWDIYKNRPVVKKALPVATILTIPAAGSEASNSTVISKEETEQKFGYNSDIVRPVLSVINPEFFYTLPKNQIANGVADMMSHVMERYFTHTKNTDLSDGLCEATLRTMIRNGEIVFNDPSNYEAWSEIAFAGTIAHNNLLGIGRDQDWACHGMEHELSAIYDIAHGAGLAVLTPAWMEYVYKENVDMFVQFAVNVMGVQGSYREPEKLVFAGIKKLKEFFDKLELPNTLSDLGIDESNLEVMAEKATDDSQANRRPLGGIKRLSKQDVINIYNMVK